MKTARYIIKFVHCLERITKHFIVTEVEFIQIATTRQQIKDVFHLAIVSFVFAVLAVWFFLYLIAPYGFNSKPLP